MSRYTDPVCKLCRREGKKLFLKGERCYTNKCSVERRSYAPGQHGQSRKKTSEYGLQLRAKQQARRYYGIQESQFRKYFEMAERRQGVTGENLLRICESRLDNVVYLLGWASSRAEGRQLVNHGHFQVNGKKVNIPSYLLRAVMWLRLSRPAVTARRSRRRLKQTLPALFHSGWTLTGKTCKRKSSTFRSAIRLLFPWKSILSLSSTPNNAA